jgi:uncharacterized protein (DUF1499 family)
LAQQEPGLWPLRLSITGVVAFAVGPLAASVDLVPPFVGFLIFVAGGALGLAGAIGGLVGVVRGANNSRLAALLVGAVPAGILVFLAMAGSKYPPINDITTDLADPPALSRAADLPENKGRDMGYPEAFKEIVRQAYPDLKPLRLNDPPAQVYPRALAVAGSQRNWRTTSESAAAGVIEAVATSRLFKFRDDIAIRIRPDGAGSVLDVRSKSRDGKGDLGANAERIRAVLAAISKSG